MKKLMFACILLMCGCAEYMALEKTPVSFVGVHDVPLSKEIIFSKTIEWAAKNFHSANDVIQLQDKATGKIVLHGLFTATGSFQSVETPYSANIDIKEGKYRIEFIDLRDYHAALNQAVKDHFTQTDAELLEFIGAKEKSW